MTYAFTFDASACTGCKACQVACKDKNNLPEGVLWRRVYEVSGGSWQKQGEAWTTDVFAYNLSIACNHCVHPKCAGVCPTDAYVQREDGIVYINESKCMGCGYCNWACPYSVPQYNPELGQMTKCNFCMDDLALGLPPACVAACPMRVLDFTVISDPCSVSSNQWSGSTGEYQGLWERPATEHPFPLPAFSRTQPHLAIKPHPAMGNGLEKMTANREEVTPKRLKVSRLWSPKSPDFGQTKVWRLWSPSSLDFEQKLSKAWRLWSPKFLGFGLDELPLVAFTLLGQMAAGMTIFSFFFPLSSLHLLAIGLLLGLGGLVSFLHLGNKKNAWRAVLHLKKSWLSREILAFGLFGLSWLAWMLERWSLNTEPWSLPTALLGLALVFSMARVYRLHAISGWNTWRTEAAFFLSAGTLGALATGLMLADKRALIAAMLCLVGEAALILSARENVHETASRLRLGLIAGCIVGVGVAAQGPKSAGAWITLPIFLLTVIEESLGRLAFYALRDEKQKLP
jgi:anaerobic dimethyl sulfoxide reductase subunit B (iron-sulfur subunit)